MTEPGFRVVQRRETYVVTGSRTEHLTEAMAILGPRRAGRVYPAYTDWDIVWDHHEAIEAAGHRIASPSVTVTITTTLPRWRRPTSARAAIVRAFEAYLATVEEHERRHAEHAISAGGDLLVRLLALPLEPTAAALGRASREIAELTLAEARRRDVELDRASFSTFRGRASS